MLDAIIGPLAGPEVRRAFGRAGPFWYRSLTALVAGGVLLVCAWICWFIHRFDPTFLPANAVRFGTMFLIVQGVSVALVLSPAMLAGTLARERERGTLELLQLARIGSRAIVASKLSSGLLRVFMLLLAALPPFAIFAGYGALSLATMLLLFVLPMAVALGAGGLALAISAMVRSPRDALLISFAPIGFLIALPNLVRWSAFPRLTGTLELVNPFTSIGPASLNDESNPVFVTAAIWSLVGVLAAGWASYWLELGRRRRAEPRSKRDPVRRRAVPTLVENPMRWKELHLERSMGFGRAAVWLGTALVVLLLAGTIVLSALVAWNRFVAHDPNAWPAKPWLDYWLLFAGWPLCLLVQGAVAIRASTSIAGERQRQTWDSLLASPLEGRDIVPAKLLGSLHGMRALMLAAPVAWSAAFAAGVIDHATLLDWIAKMFVGAFFLAALGVWISLVTTTVPRAMTVTLGSWLGASLAVSMLALLLVLSGGFLLLLAWLAYSVWTGTDLRQIPAWPIAFGLAVEAVRLLLFLVAGVWIALACQRRFDDLTGRSG